MTVEHTTEANELADIIKPAAAHDYWPQKAAELVLAAGYRKEGSSNDRTIPEGKDSLDMELIATLPGGVTVPVELSLVYPEGMGFHAVKSMQMLVEESLNQVFNSLVQRQDASIMQALLNSGHQYEEDED